MLQLTNHNLNHLLGESMISYSSYWMLLLIYPFSTRQFQNYVKVANAFFTTCSSDYNKSHSNLIFTTVSYLILRKENNNFKWSSPKASITSTIFFFIFSLIHCLFFHNIPDKMSMTCDFLSAPLVLRRRTYPTWGGKSSQFDEDLSRTF